MTTGRTMTNFKIVGSNPSPRGIAVGPAANGSPNSATAYRPNHADEDDHAVPHLGNEYAVGDHRGPGRQHVV